jgi:hypothetical protein
MTIRWRAIFPLFLGAAIWSIPVPAVLRENHAFDAFTIDMTFLIADTQFYC